MTRPIKLVGLDCGSTTTSAVVASARLTTSALGRVEISELSQIFRSEVVFTPFAADRIDATRLARYLDEWLARSKTEPGEIFGGGALITGLAAQRKNAAAIANLIEERMADSVIAAANDPCLESWLAFMGNCHALSKAHPHRPILNIDVGGGTTNLAMGIDGAVIATGCLFVGARHFQFAAGTYRLTGLSSYAAALLEHLKIGRGVGESLSPGEIDTILTFYLGLIEAAVQGSGQPPASPVGRLHVQVPLACGAANTPQTAITLSGGVGQLVYDRLQGAPSGAITQFGDLGGELAERIVRSPRIAGRIRGLVPEGLGRATVYGLLRHSTELSGSTLHLPHPERLPLANVPIVGRIGPRADDEQLVQSLNLAARSAPAACLAIDLEEQDLAQVRDIGTRLAAFLERRPMPPDHVLVLLVPANLAKVLGGYITRWGTMNTELIVVDEVPQRDAQFVRLGRVCEGVVPLWLYAAR